MTDEQGDSLVKSWIVFRIRAEDYDRDLFRSIALEHKSNEHLDMDHWANEIVKSGAVKDWQNKFNADIGRWHYTEHFVLSDVDHQRRFPEKARIFKEIDALKERMAELLDEIDQLA